MAGTTASALAGGVPAWGKTTLPGRINWRGIALGADARIILHHENQTAAAAILERCRLEILRLEKLFSLYRNDSQLNQLNREGHLINPDFEMLELLSYSQMIARGTAGSFDITVQPLWQLYADHFSSKNPDLSGPSAQVIEKTLQLVDYRMIDLSEKSIKLKSKGMAISLNGIAQGYITDRIADLLRQNGWKNVLINLGETYAMGRKPSGDRWKAGIADAGDGTKLIKSIALENQALATSAGNGTKFSKNGKHHHLFDPQTGASTNNYKSVSVIAPEAARADALSTAFSAMTLPAIKLALKGFADTTAIVVGNGDEVTYI